MTDSEDSKPIMPQAFSTAGGMAGASPRWTIPGEFLTPAAPMEAIQQFATASTEEMWETADELHAGLEQAADVWESSLESIAESAAAFNETLFRAAKAHLDEGVNLLQRLSTARDAGEALNAQAHYIQREVTLLRDQAEAIQIAAENFIEHASEPIRVELLKPMRRFGSC